MSQSKNKQLWDLFIEAECNSYEKSAWCDIFLARILTELRIGRKINEILDFGNLNGIGTLIACEILSGVHRVAGQPGDNDELEPLHNYLLNKGWMGLAVLVAMDHLNLSCAGELAHLLLFLYPLCIKNCSIRSDGHNEYLSLREAMIDNLSLPKSPIKSKNAGACVSISPRAEFYRPSEHSTVRSRRALRVGSPLDESSNLSSDEPTISGNAVQSGGGLFKLDPMDFDYFTSVVRSEDDARLDTVLYEPARRPSRVSRPDPRDLIDDASHRVLESSVSAYEFCRLSVQLLTLLASKEHTFPICTENSFPTCTQCIKFSIENLCNLQFHSVAVNFTLEETAELKVGWTKLLVLCLEKVMGHPDVTCTVILAGILPMMLRVTEDVITKIEQNDTPDIRSRLEEVTFGLTCGILVFLHNLVSQGSDPDSLRTFLELVNQTIDSSGGRLFDRSIIALGRRGSLILDLLGQLISAIKRYRWRFNSSKKLRVRKCKLVDSHHHLEPFGSAASNSRLNSQNTCCVANLAMVIFRLMQSRNTLRNEVINKCVITLATCGTCCCMPINGPVRALIKIIQHSPSKTRAMAFLLFERTIYRQLGAYKASKTTSDCQFCSEVCDVTAWEKLDIFQDSIMKFEGRQSQSVICHLIRVAPALKDELKEIVLFQVFFPSFVQCKNAYLNEKSEHYEFAILSSLSIFASLLSESTVSQFLSLKGINHTLDLICSSTFSKQCCAVLERSIVCEWSLVGNSCEVTSLEMLRKVTDSTTCTFLASVGIETGASHAMGRKRERSRVSPVSKSGDALEELQSLTAFWRSFVGLASYNSNLRDYFARTTLLNECNALLVVAAEWLAKIKKRENVVHQNENIDCFVAKLMESLLTFMLVTSSPEGGVEDKIIDLMIRTFKNCDIVTVDVKKLCEVFIKCSLAKPYSLGVLDNPKVPSFPTFALHCEDIPEITVEGESSASAEEDYVTADEGYDADVELKKHLYLGNDTSDSESSSNFDCSNGKTSLIIAYPKLCKLAIDLLVQYCRGHSLKADGSTLVEGRKHLEVENCATAIMSRLSALCRDNPANGLSLCRHSVVTALLEGFKPCLSHVNNNFADVRVAVLDLFKHLAIVSVAPSELRMYLEFFKNDEPPLTDLLKSFVGLVGDVTMRPSFFLVFPVLSSMTSELQSEKAIHRNHRNEGIMSSWACAAVMLNIPGSLNWSPWVSGYAVSLWVRIDRSSRPSRKSSCVLSPKPKIQNYGASRKVSTASVGRKSSRAESVVSCSTAVSDTGVPKAIADDEYTLLVKQAHMKNQLHLFSVGSESLSVELWLDQYSGGFTARATRVDGSRGYEVLAEVTESGLTSHCWHHLSVNVTDKVRLKKTAIEITLFLDGHKEIKVELSFSGLVVRRPRDLCVLLGHQAAVSVGSSCAGATLFLSNSMLFRAPIFTRAKALALAALGPDTANLTPCRTANLVANLTPLIKSETLRSTDWCNLLDEASCGVRDIAESLLLSYTPHAYNSFNIYQVSGGSGVNSIFRGTGVEAAGSFSPPVSSQPSILAPLQCMKDESIVTALRQIGGPSLILYLFARVVELKGSGEDQALALLLLLQLVQSDAGFYSEFLSQDHHKLLRKVFFSRNFKLDWNVLKAIMSACCDKSLITEGSKGLEIDPNVRAVVRNPLLLSTLIGIWMDATKNNSMLVALISAVQSLLADQHPHHDFNSHQLNRARIMTILLNFSKEQMVSEEKVRVGDAVWRSLVELVRSLLGAPPELSHVVDVMDTLLLLHPAKNTYIPHLKNSFYLQISAGQNYASTAIIHAATSRRLPRQSTTQSLDKWVNAIKMSQPSNDSYTSPVNPSKLSKALANLEERKSDDNSKTSDTDNSLISENTDVEQSALCRGGENRNTILRALDGSSQNLGSFFPSIVVPSGDSVSETTEKYVIDALQKDDGECVLSEGLLLLLRDVMLILPDNMAHPVLSHVVKIEVLLVMANHSNHLVRTAVVQLIAAYLRRAGDDEINKFHRLRGYQHLANQVALFPASFTLAEACLNLITPCTVALDDPSFINQLQFTPTTLSGLAPLIALLSRSVHDHILAQHIINVLKMIFCKSNACARSMVEHGLVEVLVKSLLVSAHLSVASDQITSQDIIVADIQSFFVLLTNYFIAIPGVYNMQMVCDLRLELQYVGRVEQESCGASSCCVRLVRQTQSLVFERCLDSLLERILALKRERASTIGPSLADDFLGARSVSSSISSQSQSAVLSHLGSKDLSKNDLKDRLGLIIEFSAQFLVNEAALEQDQVILGQSEQNFIQHLFPLLLQLMSSVVERKSYGRRCMATAIIWSLRETLRQEGSELLLWLLCPRHALPMRLFAINSLLVCDKTKDIILSFLQIHPQVEQRFTVFLWHLMYSSGVTGLELRACLELKENLQHWGVLSPHAIGNSHDLWGAECNMLLAQMDKHRGAWQKNSEAAIIRCVGKYDTLVKAAGDDAVQMTRMAVEAQNVERKALMTDIRQKVSLDLSASARWRTLTDHLAHAQALWCDPRTIPAFWQLDPTEAPHRVRTRLAPTRLNIESRFLKPQYRHKLESLNYRQPLAYLFERHRETCPSSVVIERLHCNEKIRAMSAACVITPAHEVPGEILIGESSLYFVADDKHLCSTLEADSTTWPFEDVREVLNRRFQLQERAIELFLRTGRTYLIAFPSCEEKNTFSTALRECDLPNITSSDTLAHFTSQWRHREINNFEYLTQLNKMAGRSFNDLMQYPVFPFILADYTSDVLDLTNSISFRNLKKPMAVQEKHCEQHYINNYNELVSGLKQVSLNREPYHYGSHYSNSGTILHFLVRLPPFTTMLLQYQDRNFDLPDRTFHNMGTTWRLTSCDSTTDVKELIPEFFYNPEFLINSQGFDFGVKQNGTRVDDVELPPWSKRNARLFVLIHRQALESDIVTENIGHWIDLVFGYKQTGKAAVDAINVFHPATYCGFNVASIEDPVERTAWETMVRTYGQTPRQLMRSPHPLVIQSLLPPATTSEAVMREVKGLKWGSYVGSRGEPEPRIVWRQTNKERSVTDSLLPLTTNDVLALPPAAVCLIRYGKEKGFSLINSTTVQAAIVTWNHPDGIIRAKVKKEQPLEPILQIYPSDPVTVCSSAPDAGQLWLGHASGCITVVKYTFRPDRHTVSFMSRLHRLHGHRSAVTSIFISQPFSIVVSCSYRDPTIIWDLNSGSFVRTVKVGEPVAMGTVSSTQGDVALVSSPETPRHIHLHSINGAPIGRVTVHDTTVTALCFSSAPEGISVNVLAAGLANGVIRLWDTWLLNHVRDIPNPAFQLPITSLAYSYDSQHLYAGSADGTIVVWEGSTAKYDSHPPKFLNLKSLL